MWSKYVIGAPPSMIALDRGKLRWVCFFKKNKIWDRNFGTRAWRIELKSIFKKTSELVLFDSGWSRSYFYSKKIKKYSKVLNISGDQSVAVVIGPVRFFSEFTTEVGPTLIYKLTYRPQFKSMNFQFRWLAAQQGSIMHTLHNTYTTLRQGHLFFLIYFFEK